MDTQESEGYRQDIRHGAPSWWTDPTDRQLRVFIRRVRQGQVERRNNPPHTGGKAMSVYDYQNQAWLVDWVYQDCGHPEAMDCDCYGRLHAGQPASDAIRGEIARTIEREA